MARHRQHRPISLAILLLASLVYLTSPLQAHAVAGWLDPAWAYRDPVTISNVPAALSNFQVHVVLNGSFAFAKAKSDGRDVRFTASDGVTRIPFWIETWDPKTSSASIWVKVPSIPSNGTIVYLYYGNPAARSASDGNATFLFFDDFDWFFGIAPGYFHLGKAQTVLVQDQGWETSGPHGLSVLPVKAMGHTYWGYYGLFNDPAPRCGAIGLAFSNDLATWTKYPSNPLMTDARWPSVLQVGGTFYMMYEKNYCGDSYIELATSTDGINFTDLKTIVPAQSGLRNQNPDLFLNPNDGLYYLYYYHGNDSSNYEIHVRSASSIEALDAVLITPDTVVLKSTITLASPNMLYHDGRYFLSTETRAQIEDTPSQWMTTVYASSSPTSGFQLLPGNPLLRDDSSCMSQFIFGTTLHTFTCHLDSTTGAWTTQHYQAPLGAGRQYILVPDERKWTLSGGSWARIPDVKQDGFTGLVAQGYLMASPQILKSTFSGTDYVLEAYGKLLQGRVWGLGAWVQDPANLDSINLYDDLNTTENLYLYDWVSGSATELGNAAVGEVDANTWYKLTVRARDNEIDVDKDGVPQISSAASTFSSGSVALYGEVGTLAEYSNVLVHQFAPTDPTVTVGAPQESSHFHR